MAEQNVYRQAEKNVQNAACTLGSKSIWSRSWIFPHIPISKRIFLNSHLLTTHTVILNYFNIKEYALSNFAFQTSIYSLAPKTKIFFQFLWGILKDRPYRARPSQPILKKLPKWHFFTRGWNLKLFWAKSLHLKYYESAILWFYLKYASGSVHVHIHVDKSE